MKIICDDNKCTGCLACVVTCLDHHYDACAGDAVAPRRHYKHICSSGYTHYLTYACHHCENAPCLDACCTHAIIRGEQGWVIVDRERCVGCRRCLAVCPFAIPQFDRENKIVKCDGCGGSPNCVDICPNQALSLAEERQ